jgi:hypothetical protein
VLSQQHGNLRFTGPVNVLAGPSQSTPVQNCLLVPPSTARDRRLPVPQLRVFVQSAEQKSRRMLQEFCSTISSIHIYFNQYRFTLPSPSFHRILSTVIITECTKPPEILKRSNVRTPLIEYPSMSTRGLAFDIVISSLPGSLWIQSYRFFDY